MTVFVPQGPNAAVEIGYEHPINLRACPVFPREGLVLLSGARPPIRLDELPPMGPVEAFARIHLSGAAGAAAGTPVKIESVAVPLKLAPDTDPWRSITATRVSARDLGLLRQLAYRLGRRALEETQIAFTPHGAFLFREQGIESIPAGDFFRSVHPRIFVSAGYAPVPAVSPEVLHRAFGSPERELVFIHRDGSKVGVDKSAFVPLEQALLDAQSWSGTTHETVVAALTTELPELELDSPGFRPMRDVESNDASEGS
jgi:hypothetical protein